MKRDRDGAQILIAGEAGQGTLFAGQVLAEAATEVGFQVTFTAKTGAAVRSGSAEAHVIVSPEPILYPYIERPDLAIALSADAAAHCALQLAENGLLLFDPVNGVPAAVPETVRLLPVPAEDALRRAGLPRGNENLLFLGALSECWSRVSMRALQAGLRRTLERPSQPAESALLLGAVAKETA